MCGECCKEIACSHLFVVDEFVTICSIYDYRDQYCPEHKADHRGCITSPEHPDIDYLRNGKCTYYFEEDE
jgi:hypothetical protein